MDRLVPSSIKVEDIDIPLKLVVEWRTSVRMSIGKDAIIVRVPSFMGRRMVAKQLRQAEVWSNKQIKKYPQLRARFQIKTYQSGDPFLINGDHYILQVKCSPRKTPKGSVLHDEIILSIPEYLENQQKNKTISGLLARVIAHEYHEEVETRIQYLNDKFFRKEINQVKLKNNFSNWGSCSGNGNINISTRLLFAPQPVQDYVFIHELAHLEYMNHSKKFWNLVESVDPDYRTKEKWLKVNSHLCTF